MSTAALRGAGTAYVVPALQALSAALARLDADADVPENVIHMPSSPYAAGKVLTVHDEGEWIFLQVHCPSEPNLDDNLTLRRADAVRLGHRLAAGTSFIEEFGGSRISWEPRDQHRGFMQIRRKGFYLSLTAARQLAAKLSAL